MNFLSGLKVIIVRGGTWDRGKRQYEEVATCLQKLRRKEGCHFGRGHKVTHSDALKNYQSEVTCTSLTRTFEWFMARFVIKE
jgi:hypothetical protein